MNTKVEGGERVFRGRGGKTAVSTTKAGGDGRKGENVREGGVAECKGTSSAKNTQRVTKQIDAEGGRKDGDRKQSERRGSGGGVRQRTKERHIIRINR